MFKVKFRSLASDQVFELPTFFKSEKDAEKRCKSLRSVQQEGNYYTQYEYWVEDCGALEELVA